MSTLEQTREMQGMLAYPGEIRRYIMGGNSTFTLVSKKSGQRFTYKVKSGTKDRGANWSTGNQDKSIYFVSLLTGSDNGNDFQYLGMLKQSPSGAYNFLSTRGSKIGIDAESFRAFQYVWNAIEFGCQFPSQVEFWHEGSCCICGRKLTVPESVASGIGPDCAAKMGA